MAQVKLGQQMVRRLGDLLVAEGFITEEQLIGFLSRQYGIPSITLGNLDIDAETLRLVPPHIAKKYEVLPVKRIGGTLTLAMSDPTNVFALDDVAFMTNLQILPVVAPQAAIRKALDRAYEANQPVSSMTDMMSEITGDASNVEVVEDEQAGAQVDVF